MDVLAIQRLAEMIGDKVLAGAMLSSLIGTIIGGAIVVIGRSLFLEERRK